MNADFGLPMAFGGIQNASLPGPLELPQNSSLISSGRRPVDANQVAADCDPIASTILNTLQVDPDPINIAFFSQANVDRLQKELQKLVLRHKRVRIERQSDNNLLMIMRSIYMMNRPHNPTVEMLNQKTLHDALESVSDNLDLYATYAATEERMKNVMDWGINTNVRGTRTTY
jgi:hypothetical protein